ncbi:MAG: hypothetical protein ACJAW8_001915 [Oleispira sp.]|jgi:hypothetical protein
MRKGLFIGINHYEHINSLSGCENDAIEMASILSAHASGSPNFHRNVLTSSDQVVSKKKITSEIKNLFSGESDVALLYFAGHGHFDDNVDEGSLIPQNFEDAEDGLRISDILFWASKATGIKNKIIILDCCQAGSAGQNSQMKGNPSLLADGMTILTACKKDEYAQEKGGHGVFTGLLIQALQGGAADVLGNITPGSMYAFVDSALGPWQQRPVFKTNVSSFISLKEMAPKVSLDTLRNLPKWFPEAESMYSLDPSYEPDEKGVFDEEKGKIFAQLQNCNRHSLVEPVDAEHMYYAAMNSTGCRLTVLGNYYRELAIGEKI